MATQEELLAQELAKLSFRIGDENVSEIWIDRKSIKNFLDHGSYIGLASRLKGSVFAEKLRTFCGSAIRSKVLNGCELLHELYTDTYNDAHEKKLTTDAVWNLENFSTNFTSLIGKIPILGEFGQYLVDNKLDDIRNKRETDFIASAERFRDAYQIALCLITVYISLKDRKKIEETWLEASITLEEMYGQRKFLIYYKYPLRSPATFKFPGIKDDIFMELVNAVSTLTR